MSEIKEEIDKAVGAHGVWKMKLSTAINTGKIEVPIETIRVDNKCLFGQFLYGPAVPSSEKNGDNYKKVRQLHAEFHQTAARVAELAVAGKKEEAKALIDHGQYKDVSTSLTAAMMSWKNSIQK